MNTIKPIGLYLFILFLSVELHKLGSALGWWLNGIPAILTFAHDRPFIAVPEGKSSEDITGIFPIILSKYLGAIITLALAFVGTRQNSLKRSIPYYFIGVANASLKTTALFIYFIVLSLGGSNAIDEAAIPIFGMPWVLPLIFLLTYLVLFYFLSKHCPFRKRVLWTISFFIIGVIYLLGLEAFDNAIGTQDMLYNQKISS